MAGKPKIMTPAMQTRAVELFAQFYALADVHRAIAEEFGVDVDKTTLNRYNPETVQGAKELNPHLKAYFITAREAFVTDRKSIGISHKNFRMRELMRMYNSTPDNNRPLKASLLEQAAKEAGDHYSNRREISGPHGKPVEIVSAEMTPAQAAQRIAMLLEEARQELGDTQP
jgi:hypothetical protein